MAHARSADRGEGSATYSPRWYASPGIVALRAGSGSSTADHAGLDVDDGWPVRFPTIPGIGSENVYWEFFQRRNALNKLDSIAVGISMRGFAPRVCIVERI